MNKFKKILLLLTCTMSIFLLIGCSKTKEYTEFQNAYFQISKNAESDKSFNKEYLEKLVGQKVSTHKSPENKEDYNIHSPPSNSFIN